MLVQRRVLVHRVVRHDAPQLTPGVDDGQAAPLTPPSHTVSKNYREMVWWIRIRLRIVCVFENHARTYGIFASSIQNFPFNKRNYDEN